MAMSALVINPKRHKKTITFMLKKEKKVIIVTKVFVTVHFFSALAEKKCTVTNHLKKNQK